MTTYNISMKVARDSAADWTSNDPTLAEGEIGWESDTNKMKIGDGSTAWTSLAYADAVVTGAVIATRLAALSAEDREDHVLALLASFDATQQEAVRDAISALSSDGISDFTAEQIAAGSQILHFETGGAPRISKESVCWEVNLSDETTALTASTSVAKVAERPPYGITITDVYLVATTAPTDAALIVDIHLAGTTIFDTKPQIAAAANTGGGSAVLTSDPQAVSAGALLEFFVDQIGSTVAGAGLKVFVIGYRT